VIIYCALGVEDCRCITRNIIANIEVADVSYIARSCYILRIMATGGSIAALLVVIIVRRLDALNCRWLGIYLCCCEISVAQDLDGQERSENYRNYT
jgi:hypothetical protein